MFSAVGVGHSVEPQPVRVESARSEVARSLQKMDDCLRACDGDFISDADDVARMKPLLYARPFLRDAVRDVHQYATDIRAYEERAPEIPHDPVSSEASLRAHLDTSVRDYNQIGSQEPSSPFFAEAHRNVSRLASVSVYFEELFSDRPTTIQALAASVSAFAEALERFADARKAELPGLGGASVA